MLEDPVFSFSREETDVPFGIDCRPMYSQAMNDFVHWPFFGCLAVIVLYIIFAIKFLRQYEGPGRPRGSKAHPYMGVFTVADLDGAELRKSCWNAVHPRWLLGFRLFAFCYLLSLILINLYAEGFWMFNFFTQWTFSLLTAYFGVAAWVTYKHCLQLKYGETESNTETLEEQIKLTSEDSMSLKLFDTKVDSSKPQAFRNEITSPGRVGYVMQIMFQVAGAAVLMTDSVYWLILVPYVLPKSFQHNFIDINLHCVNAVLLAIEILLNDMYYPWFRISYAVFWTSGYVFFQWILHARGSKSWPYPFLDLATPWAPAWYAGLSFLHVTLAIFLMAIVNIKQYLVTQIQVPSGSIPI
ncbi:hypothetical protein R1flu_009621 [Riccia fluitans]|uniref:Uncharacterized protein n=1 Tax=Riccia fluitans TaxID=41844 RepID=A0ABD1Z566_9MARC